MNKLEFTWKKMSLGPEYTGVGNVYFSPDPRAMLCFIYRRSDITFIQTDLLEEGAGGHHSLTLWSFDVLLFI